MSNLIERQAAIDAINQICPIDTEYDCTLLDRVDVRCVLTDLPSAQPEIIHCGDCKYFELDHFEKVDEFPIPIIVAHEICMKWSGGCRTSIDGWCFMAERRTDETD